MSGHDDTTIRRLLDGLDHGDSASLDALIAILHGQLRQLAHRQRRRWRGDDTLGTTALLHETYVKLRRQRRISTETRDHFLALASRAMRHILSTYAEQRRTLKRGGGHEAVSISDVDVPAEVEAAAADSEDILVAMNAALRRLEKEYARACRVVECRFFGDMTLEETAGALGVSVRTVKRDWAFAQAWLKRDLRELL